MILLNSLAELGMRPCGACRALVTHCRHWRPGPPPEMDLYRLMRLADGKVNRAILAGAYARPEGLRIDARAYRATANHLVRTGLLALPRRGGDYVITEAGRAAYEKILKL